MATASATAELVYRDPEAALDWLIEAFGFETQIVVADPDGALAFAATAFAGAKINIGPEVSDGRRSPLALDGANTQMVQIRGDFDLDEHCARARAAGARIVAEPEQTFFGDRIYMALDPEGHLWSFGRPVPGAGGPPPEGWTVRRPSPAR